MPRLESHPNYRARPIFDPTHLFIGWIAVGGLILALLPMAHWYNPAIGWLPYWLVGAPSLSLMLARRDSIAAAWRAAWTQGSGDARRRRGAGARRLTSTARPRQRSVHAQRAA